MLAILLVVLFVLAVAVASLGIVWRGWVMTKLWAWFVVPVFGLPALGLAAAIGLSLTIGFFTYQYSDTVQEKRKGYAATAYPLGVVFLYPAVLLGIGWIVTLFM